MPGIFESRPPPPSELIISRIWEKRETRSVTSLLWRPLPRAILDVLDFGDSRYLLEVSSPGLDRKLYGPRDYLRFAGQLARVTWNDPDRGKRTDVGRLQPFEEGETTIRLVTSGEDRLEVPLDSVLEARLEIED